MRTPGPILHVWRRAAVVGLALLCQAAPGGAVAQTDQDIELAIKATFLHKFIPFVEWPSSAFSDAGEALRLCVVAPAPFLPLLQRAVASESPNGHSITVIQFIPPADTRACHMLYISDTGLRSAADILAAVGDAPVLTVTDSGNSQSSRGIIHFTVVDERVRFHIDDLAASDRGLRLSSKLLSLALTLTSREGGRW